MSNDLALLADANRMLAQVSTAKEAWQLARTAEAARRYAQMRGLGTEAINHAVAVKAKAMLMLADFVDQGQEDGTIRKKGGDVSNLDDSKIALPELLGVDPARPQAAYDAVHQARRLRDLVSVGDVDRIVGDANHAGEDLGLSGLRMKAAAARLP